MTPENPDRFPEKLGTVMPPAPQPKLGARHVLLAGVAAAALLGVSLGLWARPAMSERQMATPPPAPIAAAPGRKLQIVVDERPAPIGAPIEVLPATSAATRVVQAAPAPEPEPPAPVRPPQGLMRVQTLAPAPPPEPPQPARARPKAAPVLAAPRLVVTKARPAAKPAQLAPRQLAKVSAAAKAAHRTELARAATAKAQAHRIELAKAAKAARHEQLLLAKAEARGRAQAKAEALAMAQDDARKRARLASFVHAFAKVLPHKARPPEPAPIVVAKLDHRPDHRRGHKVHHELKVEQASLKTRKGPPRFATPPARWRAAPMAPVQRAGLMKVSTVPLAAEDRQLARAYQEARAAGVPDAQLQRQQQRWLAARSAAAREAPWAVRDVYLARIAELNGMARDAHGDGY